MELACKTGQLLWKVKAQTTSTQFIKWSAFLAKRERQRRVDHFYLARVSYQLYALQFMFGGQPTLGFKDFLLEFEDPTNQTDPLDKTSVNYRRVEEAARIAIERRNRETVEETERREAARKMKTEYSRNAWLGFVGLNRDGAPIEGKVRVKRPPPQPPKKKGTK